MKTPSLFVVGLVLGAVTIFACRAALVGEAEPDPSPPEPAPMASTGHTGHTAPEAPAAAPEAPARAIENEICPVMGNPVDPKVFVDHQGRRIGFCCPGCDKLFLQDPEPYLKKVDAEIAARAEK